ncbi:hypothetical protein DUNSADRAFT_12867 [Dunaliella salina]|uniref:F-box domain-containing protein n=1 Tax=Dunaliella salina TaxID=3046 RepID=A0ABQ7H9S4_DUNSA|nr:hypothetical protein DUNSADRAFT_12867 [Dunaliella salina]|eukprot:KAF5843605.1 hypothetical protein DUNSADRAFT_12867 [Dunaliella salina]
MEEQGTRFQHLCYDCATIVLRNLQPREIAVLSCVCKELNVCTRSLSVWEDLVRAAWRCEGAVSATCIAKYNGDWKAMYCSRMALPRSFLIACDVVGATTASIQDASAATGGRLHNILLSEAFEKVRQA